MQRCGCLRLFVCVVSLCLLLSLPAWADSQLYTNGPINGNNDNFTLGDGYTVSDSFGLGSNSTISSISFGAWVFPGDTPLTVAWSITSGINGGTVYGSGTSSLTNTLFCSAGLSCGQAGLDVYTSAFLTNVALGAGTYYLNLTNATTVENHHAYWDLNAGVGCAGFGCPTKAYLNGPGNNNTGIYSESFSIYGLNPIPEPSTVMDMLGSGGFALIGLMFNGHVRQKLFRR